MYSFDEARDVANSFFYLFVFWIRAIKIVDEVKARGERADAPALQSAALVIWREPVPPEYCITKYKNLQRRNELASSRTLQENKSQSSTDSPPSSKHLFTHFTWGAWQLLTNKDDLLRKSCHETGSRDPINAMDFLPWHYLNWEELRGGGKGGSGGGGGCWKKKQTQISWYGGTSTTPLLLLPPSAHSLQSAFTPHPPPFPLLLFIYCPVFYVVCLPPGWKRQCVHVCVRGFVWAWRSSGMTHRFAVFYISSSGSLLQWQSIDAVFLSLPYSLLLSHYSSSIHEHHSIRLLKASVY